MQGKTLWTLGVVGVLVVGLGYITYAGRPVMKLDLDEVDVSLGMPVFEEGEDTDDVEEMRVEDDDTEEAASSVETTSVADPVVSVPSESTSTSTTTETPSSPGAFTMADVSVHASKDSCWSAVNGSVYDLTSWVSRHPGGAGAILSLCGTDGSTAFNRKHGRSGSAAAALVLLKIGTLN